MAHALGVIRPHHLVALTELLGDAIQKPSLTVESNLSVASVPIRWCGDTVQWQVVAPWPGLGQAPDVIIEDAVDFDPLSAPGTSAAAAEIRQALLDWDPEDPGALLRLLRLLLQAFCDHQLAQLHGVSNDRLQFELSTLPQAPGLEARLFREPGRGQLASFGIPLEGLDLSKLAPLLQQGTASSSSSTTAGGPDASATLSRQSSSGGSHSRQSSGGGAGGGLTRQGSGLQSSDGGTAGGLTGQGRTGSSAGGAAGAAQASAGEPHGAGAPQLQGSSIKLEITFPLSSMENADVALRVPEQLRKVLQPQPQPPAWSRQSCLMEYVPLLVERVQQQLDTLCTRLSTRLQVVDVLSEVWGQPVDLNPAHLVACWHLAWEGSGVLLLLELGPGFPDDAPVVTVQSLRHLGGPGHQMVLRHVPWSPRWPAREMAGRLFNHVKEQLPSIVGSVQAAA